MLSVEHNEDVLWRQTCQLFLMMCVSEGILQVENSNVLLIVYLSISTMLVHI